MSSKSRALLALLACALLAAMSMAQDSDNPWFWIMADSTDNAAVCPGRCLAVNDSANTGAYDNKRVGFVACKTADTSSNSGDSISGSSSNNNQQWLYTPHESETTIKINATGSTDSETTPHLLCLQPDPARPNQSLTVTTCTGRRNQKWIVASNTIASLFFNPPRYLAMAYKLATFLDSTDGTTAWREASFVAKAVTNKSLTTTISMVDGNAEVQLPPPPPPPQDNKNLDSRNFLRNGGFEQTSSDFSTAMSNLKLQEHDIFGLCGWQIMKTEADLQGGHSASSEGNRSLYLKDGIVKQNVATFPGAFYTLVFKVHVATPSPPDSSSTSGDQSDVCVGTDSLSVNPYPSTNVQASVSVDNTTWSTRHVSFQALGAMLQLSLKGCGTCGCFLDDVNLMQVVDSAPFPPPPPRPSPPMPPGINRPPFFGQEPPSSLLGRSSSRLSNGAVVGLVVGAAALFFVIGAAFFALVRVKEKDGVSDLRRPPEWSIQTTTPAQSERGKRSAPNSHADASHAHTSPSSAPRPPSSHSSSTVGANKYSTSQSSTNPESRRGV